jgi:hypothetical protein
MLIRVFKTRDITTLPLKRNIVPRFMKGGGAQENNEGCVGRGDQRMPEIVEKRIFMVFHVAFTSVRG